MRWAGNPFSEKAGEIGQLLGRQLIGLVDSNGVGLHLLKL